MEDASKLKRGLVIQDLSIIRTNDPYFILQTVAWLSHPRSVWNDRFSQFGNHDQKRLRNASPKSSNIGKPLAWGYGTALLSDCWRPLSKPGKSRTLWDCACRPHLIGWRGDVGIHFRPR